MDRLFIFGHSHIDLVVSYAEVDRWRHEILHETLYCLIDSLPYHHVKTNVSFVLFAMGVSSTR